MLQVNIGERLLSLPTHAYDELVERLVEVADDPATDPDAAEPSDEELDAIALRLEAQAQHEGLDLARRLHAYAVRTDPFVVPEPWMQGRHLLYRFFRSDGEWAARVVERIPNGDTFEERPVALMLRREGGWRCTCRDYVYSGDCRHTRAAVPRQRAQVPEQAHTSLCTCGYPAFLHGKCEVCLEEERERWLGQWEARHFEEELCSICGAKTPIKDMLPGHICRGCLPVAPVLVEGYTRRSPNTVVHMVDGKLFTMIVRDGEGWRCACGEYVQTGYCHHVEHVRQWDAAMVLEGEPTDLDEVLSGTAA